LRTCTRCQLRPAISNDYWCRECRRAHLRVYSKTSKGRAARAQYVRAKKWELKANALASRLARRAFIASLKADPCVDCLRSHPAFCMDFDHVRGVKSRGVSNMVSYSERAILAEVAKCDLVCACCHRVRTAARKERSTKLAAVRTKLDQLKNSPCADCGQKFPPVAMDFDHVRGSKVRAVSLMKEQAWDKVLEEIAKCDLVCAVCHRKRTHQRKQEAAAA